MEALFRKIILALAVICLGLAVSAGLVFAQTYKAGTFNVEPRVGLFGTTNDRVHAIGTYGVGLGYAVMDRVVLEAEGLGYYVDQDRRFATPYGWSDRARNANAIGVNLNGRWHFVSTNQATMFLGAGLGGMWADYQVPYNGFKSNMTENGEIGFTYAFTQTVNIKASAKYLHIGQFSNQGINAFGGTLGLNLTF